MNYQTVLQNYHPTEQGDFMLSLGWNSMHNLIIQADAERSRKTSVVQKVRNTAHRPDHFFSDLINLFGADTRFDVRDQTVMHLLKKMACFSHKFDFMLCLNCYGHSYSPKMSTISWNTSFRSLVPSTVFKTPCVV